MFVRSQKIIAGLLPGGITPESRFCFRLRVISVDVNNAAGIEPVNVLLARFKVTREGMTGKGPDSVLLLRSRLSMGGILTRNVDKDPLNEL